MPRPKNHELQKHTLNLRAGDMDKLQELFPEVGASVALRSIIMTFIDKNYEDPNESKRLVSADLPATKGNNE